MRNNRDITKVLFLIFTLLIFFGVFFLTPSLRTASLLTCLSVLLLSPAVQFLQKKKLSPTMAILAVFLVVGLILTIAAVYASQVLVDQWHTILNLLPQLGDRLIEKFATIQMSIENRLSIHLDFGITEWIRHIGQETQGWLLTHLPALIGDIASAIFLVPIFSFFILRDGRKVVNQWISFIPKKHHDSSITVIKKISVALTEFLRAKSIEAFLVGFMTLGGLYLIGAPYAAIFAIIGGITNIVPYVGPILGAAPALAIFGFSESLQQFFWPTLIVFVVVNAIDMALVFPIFVAKLVNLSPMILLAAVAVGQQFYGVVGMLIAVPMASAFKIIYQELVTLLYQKGE